MDRLQVNEVASLRREVEQLKQATTFSKYELEVLREALVDHQIYWDGEVEAGKDISEKFMKTMTLLEAKLDAMIAVAK